MSGEGHSIIKHYQYIRYEFHFCLIFAFLFPVRDPESSGSYYTPDVKEENQTQTRQITHLPDEILLQIFAYLQPNQVDWYPTSIYSLFLTTWDPDPYWIQVLKKHSKMF